MHISLSQKEITAAVRAYVAGRGIGAGLVLSDVKFTATRGSAGIIAELTLDEGTAEVPGFTDRPADTATIHSLGSAGAASTVGALIASAADVTTKAEVATTPVAAPAAAEVTTAAPAEEVKSVPEATAAAVDAGAVAEPAPAAEAAPAADVAPAAAPSTTSLFG